MPEMDDGLGSGGVVKKKKKSSSGCLIIKKKGEFSGSGVGPSVSSRTTNKEFGSGDESRGNFNDQVTNEPIVYSRRAEESIDRKRSRIDLFEFDEYDEFHMRRMNNDYMEMVKRSGGAREFGSGSRAVMIEKRKRAYFDGLVSRKGGKTESTDHGGRRRDDSDEEESAGAIRLQGKSGVLKVMVNKKKKTDSPSVKKLDHQQVEDKKQFQSKHDNKKKIPVPSTVSSDSERSQGHKSSMKSKKVKVGKHMKSENLERDNAEIKSHKSQLDNSKKAANRKERSSLPDSGSMKAPKREEKKSLRSENVTPVKVKERKTNEKVRKESSEEKYKHNGNTEKQLLREKIREMLVKAGWKIDYRPRRGRDYLDSVYINPSGTAYWSIIKAYDAFQKQMPKADDVNIPEGESSSFAPLPNDLLKKLTRKTRRKMEEEMKKKKAVSEVAKKAGLQLHEEDSDSGHELSDDSGNNGGQLKSTSDAMEARKFRKIGRCTLLARNPEDGQQNMESDGYIPYAGKRTLLAWLIDSETVQLSEKVKYMNRKRTRVKLQGWITREGIHCGCCSKILTVSKFELHAGSKKLRQPFQNIVLESGLSLLECLINAWNKQDESIRQDFNLVEIDGGDDQDDDTCGICADGGDLICCDGCPSTFHQSCLGIKMLPAGDWHCPNCTCKFCGTVETMPVNYVSSSELRTCNLCEKKYHKSCSKGVTDPMETSECVSPYCGKNCREIHDRLQKIIGVKHELKEGLSWSLLRRTDLSCDTENRKYPQRVECNSKLAVAFSVIDECFLPIIDRRSGINQIHNVVYNCGSNFNRLNYRGFYTVVLERGDEIISAASIRLRGTQLAELPFIGTRNMYRRQGMCRQLFSAIESVLCSLKIEKLVIPAISEHIKTWVGVFGFETLEDSHRKELKSFNMLVFPGVDMLQKPLLKLELSENVIGIVSNESSPKLESPDVDSSGEEKCADFSHEVEEDSAPIEHIQRSFLEASIKNGVELPPSVSKTGESGASGNLPKEEESALNLAEESRKDDDPTSARVPPQIFEEKTTEESRKDDDPTSARVPLQIFEEKTTNSYSISTFENIPDAETQLQNPVVSENEGGDANISTSLVAGGSNQQPLIEAVSNTEVSDEEDVYVEIC